MCESLAIQSPLDLAPQSETEQYDDTIQMKLLRLVRNGYSNSSIKSKLKLPTTEFNARLDSMDSYNKQRLKLTTAEYVKVTVLDKVERSQARGRRLSKILSLKHQAGVNNIIPELMALQSEDKFQVELLSRHFSPKKDLPTPPSQGADLLSRLLADSEPVSITATSTSTNSINVELRQSLEQATYDDFNELGGLDDDDEVLETDDLGF